ncbi:MAG TPA: ATP-binding protein [Propionibacteriaceae bacterium]|nr:ATP-binding protein [Propionibacteriaceae bacterium]
MPNRSFRTAAEQRASASRAASDHLTGDAAIVSAALERLGEAVVVLVGGEPNRVLAASAAARRLGLVDAGGISQASLRQAAEEVRDAGDPILLTLEVPPQPGQAARHLEVTVTGLPLQGVLIEAIDRSSLQRVDATRRDFVANVSHELKTPIGGVLLLAEAIEEAADDPGAVRHFGERLRTEASRLTDMVNQLIDLSRLQAEEPLRDAEPLLMEEVIDEALGRCQMAATRKKTTLLTTGDAGGFVWGEEPRLIDAIANLVLNAIAYSDRESRVQISARRVRDDDGRWIEVAVSDRGIGIAEADLDRIFERFYRVDYGRSRAHGGTGLGLSIVRHIAESHGGSIRVTSVLGEGSTFTLRLPEYTGVPEQHDQPAEG